MTLIVETGARVPEANSYVDVATADLYHAARNNLAWADLETADKEAALVRATDFLSTYRARWKGERVIFTQSLDWPRAGAIIDANTAYGVLPLDVIPQEVIRACCELALRTAGATVDLAPDLSRKVLSESVGSLSVTYDRDSPEQVRFDWVDTLLGPVLMGGPTMIRLVRT